MTTVTEKLQRERMNEIRRKIDELKADYNVCPHCRKVLERIKVEQLVETVLTLEIETQMDGKIYEDEGELSYDDVWKKGEDFCYCAKCGELIYNDIDDAREYLKNNSEIELEINGLEFELEDLLSEME